MAKVISLFTDGACSGNPGPGGWACILTDHAKVREMSGFEASTTNNRMELQALIEGLKAIKKRENTVKVYADSVYVLRGASQWRHGWKRKGWKTQDGGDVINRDLWEELDRLMSGWSGNFEWHYLKGHAGIPANERCDEMAVAESKREHVENYVGSFLNYGVDLEDIPDDTSLPEMKARGEKPSKPYGYLSLLGGRVVRHADWSQCERRVKGQSGAKFKKVMSADEEARVLESWGVSSDKVSEE